MQLDDPVEAKCGDYLQCEDVPAMMEAYACFHRETLALGKGGEFWVYDPSLFRRAPLRLNCDCTLSTGSGSDFGVSHTVRL
jgi:hypothetical protein